MSLERIANYSNIGTVDYRSMSEIQSPLVEKRKLGEIPDTILICRHPAIIDFGMAKTHNKFSEEFLEEIRSKYGSLDESTIINHLEKLGISFAQTDRGGGAAYIDPGHVTFYPIVSLKELTGSAMAVGDYKLMIDRVMHKTLTSYGIPVQIVEVAKKFGDENGLRRDRRDVWIHENGTSIKFGGKGIRVSGGIAYHGFQFYLSRESTIGFRYINACGYPRTQLDSRSVEDYLDREIDPERFIQRTLKYVKRIFNYTSMEETVSLENAKA